MTPRTITTTDLLALTAARSVAPRLTVRLWNAAVRRWQGVTCPATLADAREYAAQVTRETGRVFATGETVFCGDAVLPGSAFAERVLIEVW